MHKLITHLKKEVIRLANDDEFIHHDWYVTHHLEIVDELAHDLCLKYPNADQNIVEILVWIHDYAKIKQAPKNQVLEVSQSKLTELGFSPEIIQKVIVYLDILEKKEDLVSAPIEVQIVSSADGAAHMIGPFFLIFWKEFNSLSIEKLMAENRRKVTLDWEKKIVLPELKKELLPRYQFWLEAFGEIPTNISDE